MPGKENLEKPRTLLITGGTGSLGRVLVRALIDAEAWQEIRVFSRDEHKQALMKRQFPQAKLRMVLGDVRDRNRLQQALRGCTHVLHLAALKHVPACEAHPSEAVHTNVLGALHLVETAIEAGVERFGFISTDKAVSPLNLYGATKLVAEKIFMAGNHAQGQTTRFFGIRFGNFFGSRGDVISLFRAQRKQGVLTLTDSRMTRFWISLEDAAKFAVDYGLDGSMDAILIPKMRSLHLTTLAQALAPECQTQELGRRSGEKLHELLISQDEAHLVRDLGSFYGLFDNETKANLSQGKPVPAEFQWRSDLNDRWWDQAQLQHLLEAQDSSDETAWE